MAKKSLLKYTPTDVVRRTILREAVDSYRNELLGDEERMMLQDRIKRLRRQLRLVTTS